MFRNIYVHAYASIHAVTISNKRDHGFEGQFEGGHAKLWKEKRKGRNVIIKL